MANPPPFANPQPPSAPRTRGRPRLGVVAREVTLLPRHWEWLSTQPGGASIALRKLVEAARRANREQDELRQIRDNAYQFMSASAGDLPGFEEASRALFANNEQRFRKLVGSWPVDIRDGVLGRAFPDRPSPPLIRPWPLDEFIPPEKRETTQRIVDTAFGGSPIDAATRLAGGAAGAATVIRMRVSGADYLLRLEAPPSPLHDTARQYVCLKIAGDSGVAPRLVHADADHGIAITEFIQATPGADAPSRTARIRAIVETVKTLHGAPLFPRLMPYLDCVASLIDQFRGAAIAPADAVQEPFRLYRELAAAYPRHEQVVSSHNDLNPSNVLFAGQRPWIVDWESAFAADAYVDLAAIANFFAVNGYDEEMVLRIYFGPMLTDYHRARLFLMQQVNRMFYAMVLLNSVAAAKPQTRLTAANLATPRFHEVRHDLAALATHDGRLRFGCVFLNEMLSNLKSRRFAEAVDTVNSG
jgi:thiamine kinase-like enzyme